MRKSVTQKHKYGCAVACLAFLTGLPYEKVVRALRKNGRREIDEKNYYCKELVNFLNKSGLSYTYKYLKFNLRRKIYEEGTIIFIQRSKHYPAGHYLARHNGFWMDPWINLPKSRDIKLARSGFRKRLPGKPIYAISPLG